MPEQNRRPLLAANWKMYKTIPEARSFAAAFLPLLQATGNEVLICPPAPSLAPLAEALKGSAVAVGAQNMHAAPEGAYTGELSAAMVLDTGASHCLLGHSERRQYFAETAAGVAQKAQAALAAGLTPVVCVGESLALRESGQALSFLRADLQASLAGVEPTARLVVAYEPVWAIGTGKVATPADAEAAIAHLRAALREIWGETAEAVRILYGGSVKPENIAELLACPNIDGALVGGASLNPESFAQIANTVVRAE